MTAIATLLDKARERCSMKSDNALAGRMGISRALISGWRTRSVPVPEDRIAQLAELAHEEAGYWLVRVKAEQENGAVAKAWQQLARKLGAAAAITLAVALPYHSAGAGVNKPGLGTSPQMYIMSFLRRLLTGAPRHVYG